MAEARQHNHILLTQSGCLTQMACRHYSNNKLTGEFLMVVEEHLRSCQMCRDAVEGMGMISPHKNDDDQMREQLASVEKRIDAHAAGFKSKEKSKQRRLMYISGLAASIVVLLTILVTARYDRFLNIEIFAEHAAEEIPIDQMNIELAAYEGRFHAPVKDQSDRSEAGFASTSRNRPKEKPETGKVSGTEARNNLERENNNQATEPSQVDQEQMTSASGEGQQVEKELILGDADVPETQINEEELLQEDGLTNRDDEGGRETQIAVDNTMPVFAGSPGTEKFRQYLEAEYYRQRPGAETAKSLAGIKISGSVNKNGKLGNIAIENAADKDQEQLLMNIISRAPRWKPAEQNGEQIRAHVELQFKGEQQTDTLSR